MLKIIYSDRVKKQLVKNKNNPRLIKKFREVALATAEHPFEGLGKPEALKHNLQGLWSRRLDKKNRMIYEVVEPDLIIISFIGHYDDN